jgi:lipopolysaccharide biosynthesis glycosyltransferase
MAETIDIALGFDAGYTPHAAAVIASVVRHAPGARFRFILIYADVDPALKAKVESCAPGASFVWAEVGEEDLPAFATRGHFNRSILFRIGLERLAPPDCKRVLYLDADLVVLGDVRDLWRTDLAGLALGAMRDCYRHGHEFAERWQLPGEGRYFNSGVLLIDLVQVRAQRMFTAAADFIARHDKDLLFADQDALNWVFWRRWRELDPAWNVQRYMKPEEIAAAHWGRATPGIVHFLGLDKPWMPNAWHPWAWLYWESQKRTPFAGEVAAANKMDLYQLMRLRLRWWIKRPQAAGAAR